MGKRKYILNQNFFDDIDTEEKAYWLGFLYADGYNNEKRKEVKIRLAIKDEEHLLKLRDTLYIKKIVHYIMVLILEKINGVS